MIERHDCLYILICRSMDGNVTLASINSFFARRRVPPAAWFIVSIIVVFVARWPFIGMPLSDDEGGYAYVAQRWLDGRGHLYHDLWVSRPQGILLVYGLIFETLGHGTVAIRLGAAIAAAATLGAVWLFAREWGGVRLAIPAALTFAVVSGSPSLDGPLANAEIFMAVPVAYAVWILLRSHRRAWSLGSLLAIGSLAGIATLLKPTGVVILPVAALFVFWSAGEPRVGFRRSAWLGAGFALALVPAVLHGWYAGWHAFVFAVITFRTQRQNSATLPTADQLKNLAGLVVFVAPFLTATAIVLFIKRRLAPATPQSSFWSEGLAIAARGKRPICDRTAPGADARFLLSLWLAGSAAGVALGGGWFPHYLEQLAAPFAIWFAATSLGVVEALELKNRVRLVAAIALLTLAPLSLPALLGSNRAGALLLGPGYESQNQIATYVHDHSPAETPMYVAFSQPSIYYFADRPASYRYLFTREIISTPAVYDDLIAMISGPSRPLYVVGSQRGNSFPDGGRRFWSDLASRYHLEITIGDVPIYRANSAP